jgi:hypothetical protein
MTTPAGWYPDNNAPGSERYWDGSQWTEQTRAGGAAPTPPPTAQQAWGAPMGNVTPAAPAAKKNWFLRHKVLSAIGAFILIGIIASAAGGGSTDSNNASDDSAVTTPSETQSPAANKPKPKPKPAAPKPAIVTTSKSMIALLESNALKAKNTYEDKRVSVTGYVGNIDASGDYFSLDPEPDAFILTGVQVQTDEKFKNQIAGFTKNQKVTVTGKITNVGEIMGYSLEAEVIK